MALEPDDEDRLRARVSTDDQHLSALAETIAERGAAFRSLNESWADITTAAGKMVLTVFASIAEFERSLIRERTSADRTAARARGVLFGRPRKLSSD